MAIAAAGNNRSFLQRATDYLPSGNQVLGGVLVVGCVGTWAITVISVIRLAGSAATSPQRFVAGVVCGVAARIFSWIIGSSDPGIFFKWSMVLVPLVGRRLARECIQAMNSGNAWDPFYAGAGAGYLGINLLWQILITNEIGQLFFDWEPNGDPEVQDPPADLPPLEDEADIDEALPLPQPPAPAPLSPEVDILLSGEHFSEDNLYQLCDLILQQKLTVPMFPTLIEDPRMAQIPAHRIYDLLLWANAESNAMVLEVCRRKFSMWNKMVGTCAETDTNFEGFIAREETNTVRAMLDTPCLSSFCLTNQLRGLVLTGKTQLSELITSNQTAFNRIPREKRNDLFPEA